MGMDRAAAAARAVPAEPSGTDAGLTLAALIDVLDRADEVLVRTRPRPRRGAMHRPASARTVADRWDPLRDLDARSASPVRRAGGTSRAVVRSAGTGRPVPRVVPARAVPLRSVPAAAPVPVQASPAPGAGAVATASPAAPASHPERRTGTPFGARLRAAVSAVVRRAALWGAGPGGAHLAWNAPRPVRVYRAASTGTPPERRQVDPPVVLRELPSTPTVPPAPRSARPQVPMTSAPRPAVGRTPVRSLRAPALSTVRRIPPLPAARGTVPSRARSPGGVRGSPGCGPARGSPPWWPEPG